MENRNGAAESADDHNTGTWILALTSPGKGYLGRVQQLADVSNPYEYLPNDSPNAQWTTRSEIPVNEVLSAEVITLFPVYDYIEQMKEVPIIRGGKVMEDPQIPGMPAMRPTRAPQIMPVGFTVEQAPVHVPGLCYGTVIRFLSQMDRRDADTYRNFAKDVRAQMKQMRLAASNLQAPSADDIAKLTRR